MRRVRLNDHIGPIPQCESDRSGISYQHAHVDLRAPLTPEPPLQPARMEDRSGVATRARPTDEVEHKGEVTFTIESPDGHSARSACFSLAQVGRGVHTLDAEA